MADSPQLSETLPAGAIVDPPQRGTAIGRFIVLGPLGAGGMGLVLSAYDPDLDRKVAIKLLRVGSGDVVVEAQAMARLRHPNVVAVHEIGSGFVVMEHVDGGTLRAWLATEHSWREVQEVFLGAGAGLAAAHREGIVHGDFKPDNVLIDRDRRARVADFGLVAAGPGSGTPAYMAPEQHAGQAASASSDQYAFGLSLREALPASAPAALRAVARRSLKERPEDRYPHMEALLEDLRRDPLRPRQWALAALAAAALVTAGLAVERRLAAPTVCGGDEALVASLWDDGARTKVKAAFAATGKTYAAETFVIVDAALSARQATWARAHRDACEATHVRHEQSEALLDARMRCLGRARVAMAALVTELGNADVRALDRAAQAAHAVGDIESCADMDALGLAVAPPRDPTQAHDVEATRAELARVRSLLELGHLKEATALGGGVIERARRTGYPPLLAETLETSGKADRFAALELDGVIAKLLEAAQVGAGARHDEIVALAFADLECALSRYPDRHAETEIAFHVGLAAAARAGNPPRVIADLANCLGGDLMGRGQQAAALPLKWLALELRERTFGPESIVTIGTLGSIASIMTMLGNCEGARTLHDRLVAAGEKGLGPHNPTFPTLVLNAGSARLGCGDIEGAEPLLERALVLHEEVYGPENVWAASAAQMLALLRIEQRRLDEARALTERAIRIRTAGLGPEHADVARSQSRLATIARLEGNAVEAHRLFQVATATQRKTYGGDHPALADSLRGDAAALIELGRVAEARAAVEEAIQIDRKVLGEAHPDFADGLRMLGEITCAERRCAEAVQSYRRAVSVLEKVAGIHPAALASPLAGLCEALVAAGAQSEALAVAERASAAGHGVPSDVRTRLDRCRAAIAQR